MSNENPKHNTVFVPPKEIIKRYQVTRTTLQRWAHNGDIQYRITPNGRYLYDQEQVSRLFETGKEQEETERIRICYARVCSQKQKEDLARQFQESKQQYPDYIVYQDIGSGLNWKRPQFQKLMAQLCQGMVSDVVVMHRYGFELVEFICKQFQTQLLVHCDQEDTQHKSSEEELAKDLLSIVNVFVARNNGKRSHQNQARRNKKRKREEQNQDTSKSKNKRTKKNQGISTESLEGETVSNEKTTNQIEPIHGHL